jgi:hypothetical protein
VHPSTHRAPSGRLIALLLCALAVAAGGLLAACGDEAPETGIETLYPSPAGSPADGGASPAPSDSPSTSPKGSGDGSGGDGSSGSSGGSSGSSGSGQQTISDSDIRGGILVRLSQEPTLRGIEFKVRVKNGVVTLQGRVQNNRQKGTAEQIAVSEPGVKKVVSYIRVTGGGGY